MLKAYVIGLLLGLSLLIVAVVTSSPKQQNAPELQQDEAKIYQAELVDATPVQRGVVTEQARLYSRHFSYYGTPRGNEKLSSLVDKFKGESKVIGTVIEIGFGPALPPDTPQHYFGPLSKESDTIIRGKVIKKVSHFTEDDYFIFTNYDVTVLEVLKNNQTIPIQKDQTIIVVRPGGKVSLEGMVVSAIDKSFLPLPVNQDEVLLFLKFIPEAGAYQTVRSTGAYQLQGESIEPLSGETFPSGILQNTKSLLTTVRAVSK